MKALTTEVKLYVDQYRTHAVKAVEHYIEAGKVIIRAKEHLQRNEIISFYEGCGISQQKASELVSIAKFFEGKENVARRSVEILEGGTDKRTYTIPEHIDINYEDLRKIKNIENKVLKGEANAIDLENLLSGKQTYKEIISHHKRLRQQVEADIAESHREYDEQVKAERDKDCEVICDIFDAITKLKSKEEKVVDLLHGKEVKVGRHSYRLVLVE